MALFGRFLNPYSPKYGPVLLNFSPGVVLFQTKKNLENFLKYSSFYGKGTDRKLAFLVEL